MRDASFRVGSFGSGAGATGLGSSSVRCAVGTRAVTGSGESVLAILDLMNLGGLMVKLMIGVDPR